MTHLASTHDPADPRRRAYLAAAASFIAARVVHAKPAVTSQAAPPAPPPAAAAAAGGGRLGDFDFLAGRWKIHHRRRKADRTWDEFDGEATCWTILGGTGSIEELRIPTRDFSGMGIRLLNPKTGLWDDYWVNGKDRLLDGGPGLSGAFAGGVGTFTATDSDGGTPLVVRGVWDRITPTSHRWRQGASRDGGTTWDEDWFMDWVRA